MYWCKKISKMVTCVRHIIRLFQFCKSISSKFRKILELEMKILINFSTPKNPNITFLDRPLKTQKSRCSFLFNPPKVSQGFGVPPYKHSPVLFKLVSQSFKSRIPDLKPLLCKCLKMLVLFLG